MKKNTAESYFTPLPRRMQALDIPTISFEAPPISIKNTKIPLLLRYGGALLTGNMIGIISSAVLPFLTQKYTDKEKQEYENKRQESYTLYLKRKRQEIMQEKEREQRILNQNYPPLNTILTYAESKSQLWERHKTDTDFLNLRIGYGNIPILAEYEYPSKKLSLDEDPLEQQMYDLAEKKVYLESAPIMSSFLEEPICGVLGKRKNCLSFAQNLIFQLASLYSYDEVKMIFLVKSDELESFAYIKYLPHCWDDQKSIRFLATDTMEAYHISEYLKKQMEEEDYKNVKLKELLKKRPYYFVFAFDKRIFDSMEILKNVLEAEENLGFTIVNIYDQLPKECYKIFQLGQEEHRMIHLKQLEKAEESFKLDSCNVELAKKSMDIISNLKLKVISEEYTLPKMITFLEMFGVGKIEHLNILKRWSENNPVKSLAVPVGVNTDGSLFDLDLHEKYHGPHGLVAGMTGSGKSEFIITYILSMAVNFHPDEVAFILIDYKGGGLAGAFEDKDKGIHLPHLVGTITNLDGAAIQRSLTSIQSELIRRQSIFNEAKHIANEGTMDIYTYQKLYREGIVTEPLPHLFIISDEFAELKAQQPEFMDKLISTARIGRSLGVHLILATQKPSGVVNEQIWSNTKFRVCLRVQDKSDSTDMLKRPEAAEIRDIGRFYLQVGYNEYFAMGQSAWCGADYEPQDTVVVQRDNQVSFIDNVGQVTLEAKPFVERRSSGSKQVVAIVKSLSDLAERNGIVVRRLWEDPLPFQIALDEIIEKYSVDYGKDIQALAGVVDDPTSQKQYPLILNLQQCQHYLILGNSGSGKSTLIQTLLYSLITRYTPEQLNFYIMDFSSHTLRVFEKLPHCGMCINEEQEDMIGRFFTMLQSIIDERKRLFEDAEVSSYEAYLKIHPLPLILVVIDHAALLSTLLKGTYFVELGEFMRNGVGVGIKFILSGNKLDDFSVRTRQNAGNRIALRQKDKFDYTEVLGCRCTFVPADGTGRGMCYIDGRGLEYQAALCVDKEFEQERIQAVRQMVNELAERYAGHTVAQRLTMVSETETYEAFCADIAPERLPIGYSVEHATKIAVPFQQLYALSCYFGNPKGVVPVWSNFLYAAKRNQMEIYVVKQLQDSIFESSSPKSIHASLLEGITIMDCTEENLTTIWKLLAEAIHERKQIRDDYCREHHLTSDEPEIMRQAAPEVRKSSKPILVLFERFLDVCKTAGDDSLVVYPKLFTEGKWYHYYFIAGFYPEDADGLSTEMLARKYNPDKLLLLFGGQFHRQELTNLPREYREITGQSQYNRCLMEYQDVIHPMIVPCGEIRQEAADADERPLFE